MTTVWLIVAEGMSEGTRYTVGEGTTLIGRGNFCDITLLDSAVSREHARIIKRGEHYFIYDLHSTNGTFVDNTMIDPWEGVLLKSGSVISIGETSLVFVKLPGEEPQ
jgi:pSer/pThr/pTyr-binding forkhead associated (FHA) protein